jgi:methionyl-tRNA formyltransferase
MAGDAETGVCIMQMAAGLDTGPVLLEERLAIGADETTGDLHDRLSALGAGAIVAALSRLDDLRPRAQPDVGVTYAAKIDKAEARVDWSRSAQAVDRMIRGLSPFPGAWAMVGGRRVKFLRSCLADGAGAPGTVLEGLTVACGDGAVQVTQVQPEGKGRMTAAAFLRGVDLAPSTVLGKD